MSTYPDRCALSIERRTIPGERPDQVAAEVDELCDRVRLAHPGFDASVKMTLAQAPSDVSIDAPIVGAMSTALEKCGVTRRVEGMTAWTDAAILNDAGIPAICFGPGDIGLAHSAEEYVPVAEIEAATRVLAELALSWTQSSG